VDFKPKLGLALAPLPKPAFFTARKMSLQSQDMVRMASLAKLEINPQELEHMRTSINDFFKMVQAIGSVDTTGVEPLAHPVAIIQDVTLRLREDVVSETNRREANQQSAPAVDRGLFLVPKVVE
jgi:aspartyl-tRNA(Asn)/glutamyl-tRNA(Gln) amidotransferase subunit C